MSDWKNRHTLLSESLTSEVGRNALAEALLRQYELPHFKVELKSEEFRQWHIEMCISLLRTAEDAPWVSAIEAQLTELQQPIVIH